MKKTVSIVICAVMLVCLFSGCGSKTASKGVVNVYNWGEYIDTDLITQFEQETGIKVNYKTYESNEQMYSVLKQGGVSYDVVVPSDYMVSRMIQEDMLAPLDYSKIPNFSLISDSMKKRNYDPDNKYSVPYMWGTLGIIYDSTVVGEIDSWGALFDAKNSGKILMIDNSRDAMGIALKYLGYSMNTTDKTELDKAYALLKEQKPLLQGYVMDQVFDKLESGEAPIGVYYAGDYLTMHQENPNLKFCLPKEGSNLFGDAMCVLKNAENKENAEAFINFMSGTEQSMANSKFIGYTSPNKEVESKIDIDAFTRSIMYPDETALAKCERYINLPQDTLDYYDKLWVELKS